MKLIDVLPSTTVVVHVPSKLTGKGQGGGGWTRGRKPEGKVAARLSVGNSATFPEL